MITQEAYDEGRLEQIADLNKGAVHEYAVQFRARENSMFASWKQGVAAYEAHSAAEAMDMCRDEWNQRIASIIDDEDDIVLEITGVNFVK